MSLLPTLFSNDILPTFDPFFDTSFLPSRWMGQQKWVPAVDIREDDKGIIFDMNVPGFKKDDISIDLQQNVLCICGKHEEKKEDKNTQFHRRERRTQSFERKFTLPEYVNLDDIKARYEDGVLNVVIPKQIEKEKELTQKKVEIK